MPVIEDLINLISTANRDWAQRNASNHIILHALIACLALKSGVESYEFVILLEN